MFLASEGQKTPVYEALYPSVIFSNGSLAFGGFYPKHITFQIHQWPVRHYVEPFLALGLTNRISVNNLLTVRKTWPTLKFPLFRLVLHRAAISSHCGRTNIVG